MEPGSQLRLMVMMMMMMMIFSEQSITSQVISFHSHIRELKCQIFSCLQNNYVMSSNSLIYIHISYFYAAILSLG